MSVEITVTYIEDRVKSIKYSLEKMHIFLMFWRVECVVLFGREASFQQVVHFQK
jgi:hypothetical protein